MNDVLFYEMKKGTSNKQIIFFLTLGGMVSSFHNLITSWIWMWYMVYQSSGTRQFKRDLVEDIDISGYVF